MAFEIIKEENDFYRIENGGVRAFLFLGDRGALLVDTCMEPGIGEEVRKITDQPVMVINTHADPDHTGGNGEFEEVFMNPADFSLYFGRAPEAACPVPIWENDVIRMGMWKFEILTVPGHTPGSIALLDRQRKVLISGDSVSEFPIFMFGEQRSMQGLRASLEKLWDISSAYDRVFPSHGAFPLTPEAVYDCLEGADRVLNGDFEVKDPPMDIPAKLIIAGKGRFFMSPA